jgi:hypothetical protein
LSSGVVVRASSFAEESFGLVNDDRADSKM